MLKVGLTGGIACGKTHVARRLAAHGLHVIDLDAVAHEVTAPGGAAYDDVVRAFGRGILDAAGAIDRRALGARVFADAEARRRLNALVHPRVREEETRRARSLAETGEVLVTEAALLVESGLHLRFDRLVVVDCRPEQQVERLVARDGMTARMARARLAAQMPVADKRAFAHFVVDASRSRGETERLTDDVASALRALAARPAARAPVSVDRGLAALTHGPARGPRGLTPALVLREIVEAGGPEMERLAARLVPPPARPWYDAADGDAPEAGPETLAVPVALWSLGRRGDDPEYTAGVAASLARLTHRAPAARADAALMALALAAAAVGGLEGARGRLSTSAALAERWAACRPGGLVGEALDLARRHPLDPAAARAQGSGAAAPLAGALVGIAAGGAAAPASPALAADVAALAALGCTPA
jgi:dephospho-CoA kinase